MIDSVLMLLFEGAFVHYGRTAEEERRVVCIKGARCFWAMTGMPVADAHMRRAGGRAAATGCRGRTEDRSHTGMPAWYQRSHASGWRGVAVTGSRGRSQDRLDARRTLLPGRDHDTHHQRSHAWDLAGGGGRTHLLLALVI